MKHFTDLIAECLTEIEEFFPWDLEEKLETDSNLLLVDVREPSEFAALHIPNSINVPRGILESSCEWDYEETIPELVQARNREVIVICRSGNRSVLAAHTMQRMGYKKIASLKTGVKGWNDAELPLRNGAGNEVDVDDADEMLITRIREDQKRPAA
jgi:rhodanese-related sulfurtransferase